MHNEAVPSYIDKNCHSYICGNNMIIKNQVLVCTKSLTNEQTCVVNLKVSKQTCIVDYLRETDEGGLQVMYDTLCNLTYSIPTLTFSFNDLDHFPSRCKEWFHEQLLETQPLAEPDTRLYLVDKIFEYMADLRRVEGNIDSGHIFDATLEILCFSASDVYKGRCAEENREEDIMCSICLENLTVGMEFSLLPCYHIFHGSCIGPWLEQNSSCPDCRYRLEDANEDYLENLLRLNEPIPIT